MPTGYLIRRAISLPPHIAVRKAIGLGTRYLRHKARRWNDGRRSSYSTRQIEGELHRRLNLSADRIPGDLAAVLPRLANEFLAHRFDLLGSGWTRVYHGMDCNGLEGFRYSSGSSPDVDAEGYWLEGRVNRRNLAESQRIWRLIDNPEYRPIDWQLDFKSGHRWSEHSWYLDVEIGPRPGADVKVPWELARMQHLPLLALAALLTCSDSSGEGEGSLYAREIRDQILDFVATNPPRFGVNWRCPMELGIRVANWLLAVDILRDAGVALDEDFHLVLRRSVLEHAGHIADNLEWSESGRSNHYLADIVGLLFASSFLPSSAYTNALLAFAIRELNGEAEVQFHRDGSNYEGSTSYHRLSAELLIYGSALVVGLPEDRVRALRNYDHRELNLRPSFPPAQLPTYSLRDGETSLLSPSLVRLLPGVIHFSRAITKPDGQVVQVGDTDSGRLLKVHPAWRSGGAEGELEEDHLDHRHLVSAVNALLGTRDEQSSCGEWLDGIVVRALAQSRTLPIVPDDIKVELPDADLGGLLAEIEARPAGCRRVRHFPLPDGATDDLQTRLFPDFGLCILKGSRLFLSMRCGGQAPDAPRSHIHDDNLSIELQVDGRDIIVDPGSYLYTSAPEIRNLYRSAVAHDAPRVRGKDAVNLTDLLFDLEQRSKASILGLAEGGMAGELSGKDWRVLRVVHIDDCVITVADGSWGGALRPLPDCDQTLRISIGYGKKTERPARVI